ncbi:MAG: TolC family protein [Acidobacteriota bacterium]|nr:TolC family protein [Acidobacteriota bacterium]
MMKQTSSLRRNRLLAAGVCLLLTPWSRGQAVPSLTLQQAIAAGLGHHPQVEQSAAQVSQAQAALHQARSGALPSVVAAEEVMASNDPVFAFGTRLRQQRFTSADFALTSLNQPNPIGNFGASAGASWTLFDAGATRQRIRSATTSVRAAESAGTFTGQQVATAVTRLFYRVLLAEDEVAVAEAAKKRAQQVAEDIQDRVKAGLSLDVDGARASLAAQSAADDLQAAQDMVKLARRDLADAMGEASEERPLDRSDLDTAAAPNTTLVQPELPQPALLQRSDIQALTERKQAAQQQLAAVRATAWPRLSTYGHVEADSPHLASGGGTNWTVGAKLELQVFDGGARRAQQQAAAAEIRLLEAQKQETLREARSSIASLQSQSEDLQRRYATAATAIATGQQARDAARDRYTAGLVPLSEVLTTESELTAAQYSRVKIFYQLRVLSADLALASGGSITAKAGQP